MTENKVTRESLLREMLSTEQANESSNLPTVAFSVSKKELYTPSNGFKTLQRRLRGQFKVVVFKEDMVLSKLVDIQLLVFGAPREKFSTAEVYRVDVVYRAQIVCGTRRFHYVHDGRRRRIFL